MSPSLTSWSTSGVIAADQAGKIFRFKYSGVNIHGEGHQSDEVAIMMAEKPGTPTQLTRVDMNSLAAGEIRIHWELPSDQGATPVIGYKIYLNSELNFDASTDATINSYTYTGLNVGQIYTLGVTALNFKGESILATISKLSASIPAKMPPLVF